MAAFDNLQDGVGQDIFDDLYTKYNDTMDELKGGTTNQLLAGNGIGSVPTFKDVWETPIIVGEGGGAPSFGTSFVFTTDATSERLRFSKSILSSVSIFGRFRTSAPVSTPSGVIFTLPVGYRPSMIIDFTSHSSVGEIINFRISPNGELTARGKTGSASIASGTEISINCIFVTI